MIAFTSDIDWAPEEVIKDMLDIFIFYNTKCTLFATHLSDVIKAADPELFEIAIHPNFNPMFEGGNGKTATDVIRDLKAIYPEAIGVRSHSMTQSSKLLQLFKDEGLLYDSNHFFPYNFEMKPFHCWNNLFRIPYNWEDDIHFMYKNTYDTLDIQNYTSDKYYIFDFHPIHTYINTTDEVHYNRAKDAYHDVVRIKQYINQERNGVRDYLINTLEYIQSRNLTAVNLKEVLHGY